MEFTDIFEFAKLDIVNICILWALLFRGSYTIIIEFFLFFIA
ncbi:hypothetical protein LEP1GSC016_0802 [Leptospira borgpetersenii serovar Hardjo-bovis str. Sponselee]|uniref:Uncharacterized protein n=1 Tax=Leptospira borgpetersenii serovar Hardjo-bovis str. Sponselee TaxID=1303729 RepID=M6C7U8_LEPBO|nr:hypothetical protein LEP1GSC016_0802 [Leptospira borgpetersenii serovar Hardjo-bovis str. Sponselee]